MRWIPLLISALIGFSCRSKTDNAVTTTSESKTPEGAVVESLIKEYYQDMSARDWKKYRMHFWENATITTAWQQPGDSIATVDVTTIDDFIKETPHGPDSKPIFEETMKAARINLKGNIAEAWVDYEAKFGSKDTLNQWTGTDVFTLLRHNGEWKIVSLVFEAK